MKRTYYLNYYIKPWVKDFSTGMFMIFGAGVVGVAYAIFPAGIVLLLIHEITELITYDTAVYISMFVGALGAIRHLPNFYRTHTGQQ